MIIVKPVILCGGSGARLWPLSRTGFPKQFLCLTGKESLFQQAACRLMDLACHNILVNAPLIVTGEEHRFLASEQLREAGIRLDAALLEPAGRNTAPALSLAALYAIENGDDPVLVVTPADQTVVNGDAFVAAIQKAIEQAANGAIVVMGVTPSKPETGYGYIQVEVNVDPRNSQHSVHKVKRFVEKPNATNARLYLNEGSYYWNAGIFVLRASVWLKALKQFRPDIHQATVIAWNNKKTDSKSGSLFVRPGKEEFIAVPSESVDYAVMERCPNTTFLINMVPFDVGWSDLGAWDSVWDFLPKDEKGNAYVGDVIATHNQNTLVHASSRLVGVIGLSNLIVVETPDAVLIANKARSQDVKEIVAQLQAAHREEHTIHRKVYRPWGWYDSIDEGSRFKVKRILVNAGASLSLQKHLHRAEHWIVVRGTAEITNGKKLMTLNENQSTFIPLGVVHRLVNTGETPLEIIEVQSGNYLGEDDIVRIEDVYGRLSS
jgi:mannose-1-phosphate guanylyltransferase/mannose-6-phosphate isomerase